jgi:LysR family transcriptional regulator, glycine cleavage system transcriptional activator
MAMPSLKFLKTFHIAARHESFKAAADELCITASAVSHQMKLLEAQLGLTLFERGPRSLKLTAAGSYYLDNIESLFSRIESVTEQLRQRFSRSVARLQVTPFFASELLFPNLNKFSERYPDIDLQISTRATSQAEHAADADVSVLVGAGPWPELTTATLFPQSFVPVCAPHLLPKFSISKPADLKLHTLIAHNTRPTLWQQWAVLHGMEDLTPKQVIRLDSMSAAVTAAESGVGIALVSTPLAAERFAAGTLAKVLHAEIPTGEHYVVVVRPYDHAHPVVRVLSEWLIRQFGRTERAAEANLNSA